MLVPGDVVMARQGIAILNLVERPFDILLPSLQFTGRLLERDLGLVIGITKFNDKPCVLVVCPGPCMGWVKRESLTPVWLGR